MKRISKVAAFFLAIIVLLSSVGHVFTFHYCMMTKTPSCQSSDCCSEKTSAAGDCSIDSQNTCCVNALNYLINPFSVRIAEVLKINVNPYADNESIRCCTHLFSGSFQYINNLYSGKKSPPLNIDFNTFFCIFRV